MRLAFRGPAVQRSTPPESSLPRRAAVASRADHSGDFAPGYVLDPNQDATGLVDDAVSRAIQRTGRALPWPPRLSIRGAKDASYGNTIRTTGRPGGTGQSPRSGQPGNRRCGAAMGRPSPPQSGATGSAASSNSGLPARPTATDRRRAARDFIRPAICPRTVPVRPQTPRRPRLPRRGSSRHVRHSEGIYVGYRWFDARRLEVDYPFGHGLSYTTFDYAALDITVHNLDHPIAFTVALSLTNTGARNGAEVVQVYVGDRSGVLQMPERELRAFAKVQLTAGASQRVEIAVARRDLEHYHPEAGWVFARRPDGGAGRVLIPRHSTADDRRGPRASGRGPLTVWSQLGDWINNPATGPALRKLIEERGGIKGRIGDLLSDPVSERRRAHLSADQRHPVPRLPHLDRGRRGASQPVVKDCSPRQSGSGMVPRRTESR